MSKPVGFGPGAEIQASLARVVVGGLVASTLVTLLLIPVTYLTVGGWMARLKARRPNQEQKRVHVDFPVWMIRSLDKEAKRLGVLRQSLIKVLIAQHLEKAHA